MINGSEAFRKVCTLEFQTLLDIGSGSGVHAAAFRKYGKVVTTVDLQNGDIVGDYLTISVPQVDCIWACHVLEHQTDVGAFLRKCFSDLKEDGIFAVTVPPRKDQIVGGHLTLWNAGLLLYNLILAGFDCKTAAVKTYGYNISVIVRKVQAVLPPLAMDFGDIERLARFFPMPVSQGFDGNIQELNW